ncbi:MAG: glycosyltransferase [Aridibacter sp.]
MKFKKLLFVIPTRNRADFAINAIRSILNQETSGVEIVVSDNSTDGDQITELKQSCDDIKNPDLTHIRPPKPLPMTEHWDWAMNQVINLPEISHVAYFSDRYVFAAGLLTNLIDILIRFPDKVVSYTTNPIDDSSTPVILHQIRWSGKIFEIETSKAVHQYAQTEILHSMPRMINCAVPIQILESIKQKFGNYFSSVSPDYNFLSRMLDTTETFLYYDRPLFLNYGMERSSGRNILKGNFQKDATDFIKNMKTTRVNFSTPVDEIRVMPNAVMIEYYDVKITSPTNKFPKMNREKYFTSLVENVLKYENPQMKREMTENLIAEIGRYKLLKHRIKGKLQRKLQGLKVRLHNMINPDDPYILRKPFETVEQAIASANENPRKASESLKFAGERIGTSTPENVKVIQNFG